MEEPKASIQSRKRALELNIQDSPYYKMRALLRDLRPQFIEVLKTPDFRNCKAADDIREGMKLMMDLYKEMTESIKLEKCNNVPGNASNDNHDGQKPVESPQDVKPAESPFLDAAALHHAQGTYVVGGSAIGWNFVTFHGAEAVYYGQTKAAFRARNPKSA